MRMLFISAAAAALSISSPALAEKPEVKNFTHDGTTYSYTVIDKGAAKVISGKAGSIETPFRLVLANGRVSGYFGSYSVAFTADEAKGATNTGGAELIALLTK